MNIASLRHYIHDVVNVDVVGYLLICKQVVTMCYMQCTTRVCAWQLLLITPKMLAWMCLFGCCYDTVNIVIKWWNAHVHVAFARSDRLPVLTVLVIVDLVTRFARTSTVIFCE